MKTTICICLNRFISSELSLLLFFFFLFFFAHFSNFLQLLSAAGRDTETCLGMQTGNYLQEKWKSYSLLFYSPLLEQQQKKKQKKVFLMGVEAPPTSRRDLRLLLDIPKTRLVAFIF